MIHPQAIVDPSAKIADDVTIGPFSVIGANVEIDSGTTVASHVVINGPTTIGKDNRIFQFASVGEKPQDLKFNDDPTELIVGDRNTIREYVTLHRGTPGGANVTRIGNDNLYKCCICNITCKGINYDVHDFVGSWCRIIMHREMLQRHTTIAKVPVMLNCIVYWI